MGSRRALASSVVIVVALLCTQASGGTPAVDADRIEENLDSSKTITRPEVLGGVERLGIRQGIPGACHLFGMDGYLKEYMVWSADLKLAVQVHDDGTVADAESAHYVVSMTCTPTRGHMPEITVTSRKENPDGSVTMTLPQVHHGPRRFLILSGHTGACRLLGYAAAVESSREWSEHAVDGVSLAMDGKIYEKASGTFLTALACTNEPQKRRTWVGNEQGQ